MALPRFGPGGLLPAGIHTAELDEVERIFAGPGMPNPELRRAVLAGVRVWAMLARGLLGPGLFWLSGGFVSTSEADDHALVAYFADDEDVARRAMMSGFGMDLVTLHSVAYAGPGAGGACAERRPVGGIVDALIAERNTRRTVKMGFQAVVGPDGFASGATKGFVEVKLP